MRTIRSGVRFPSSAPPQKERMPPQGRYSFFLCLGLSAGVRDLRSDRSRSSMGTGVSVAPEIPKPTAYHHGIKGRSSNPTLFPRSHLLCHTARRFVSGFPERLVGVPLYHYAVAAPQIPKHPPSVFWALPFASAQPRGHGTNAAAMSFRTKVRNLDLSVDSHIPKDDTGATLRFLTFVQNDMIYDGCGRTSTAPHCGMVVNQVQDDCLPDTCLLVTRFSALSLVQMK